MSGNLRPLTFWTVVLNRHYVDRDLKSTMMEVSDEMSNKFPNSTVLYLDANFPFVDGFPLIPHLSHDDGKKLDLAFFYMDLRVNKLSNSAPSYIGYGVYESPINGEVDFPNKCEAQGFWQYGFIGKLIPKWNSQHYVLDVERTKFIIQELTKRSSISKIFIEPHLKQRWGFKENRKIRFHGCQAVRHDDHIHLQIK